jgi:hypothetical protein
MCGNALNGFFNHNWPIELITAQAEKAGLIAPIKMETRTVIFQPPRGESIWVEFEIRKGASESEVEVAFALALAKQGTKIELKRT